MISQISAELEAIKNQIDRLKAFVTPLNEIDADAYLEIAQTLGAIDRSVGDVHSLMGSTPGNSDELSPEYLTQRMRDVIAPDAAKQALFSIEYAENRQLITRPEPLDVALDVFHQMVDTSGLNDPGDTRPARGYRIVPYSDMDESAKAED